MWKHIWNWIVYISAVVGLISSCIWLYDHYYPKRYDIALDDMVNKAVAERASYKIGAGSDVIELTVDGVWIGGKQLEVSVGLSGEIPTPYEIPMRQSKLIEVGGRAYSLAVHDLADVAISPDIAVISLLAK